MGGGVRVAVARDRWWCAALEPVGRSRTEARRCDDGAVRISSLDAMMGWCVLSFESDVVGWTVETKTSTRGNQAGAAQQTTSAPLAAAACRPSPRAAAGSNTAETKLTTATCFYRALWMCTVERVQSRCQLSSDARPRGTQTPARRQHFGSASDKHAFPAGSVADDTTTPAALHS